MYCCTLNKKQAPNANFPVLCNTSFIAVISTEKNRNAHTEKKDNEKKKDTTENLKH